MTVIRYLLHLHLWKSNIQTYSSFSTGLARSVHISWFLFNLLNPLPNQNKNGPGYFVASVTWQMNLLYQCQSPNDQANIGNSVSGNDQSWQPPTHSGLSPATTNTSQMITNVSQGLNNMLSGLPHCHYSNVSNAFIVLWSSWILIAIYQAISSHFHHIFWPKEFLYLKSQKSTMSLSQYWMIVINTISSDNWHTNHDC